MATSPSVATAKAPLLPILLVNFIGTLGYTLVFPFLIFLVKELGGNEVIYGLLGATYAAFQLVGAPILGKWSDEIGRKKILLLTQAGTLLSWMIFLVALYLPFNTLAQVDAPLLGVFTLSVPLLALFAARALDGITGGNISVANAYLADISTAANRKSNFGKMGASANLGAIAGPALAGLLGATYLEEKLPVIAAIIVSAVALWLIAFRLPESKMPAQQQPYENSGLRKVLGHEHNECTQQKMPQASVWQLPHVPFLLVLYFILFLGFNIFYTGFPVHAQEGLAWNTAQLGIFFSVLSLAMIVVQGPVLTSISARTSDETLIIGGSFVLGISFLFLLRNDTWAVYSAALCFAVGNGLMWPSFLSLLTAVGGDQHQGALQGMAGSLGSLASIIGLILGGILYNLLGSWVFAVSASLILTVFILSFRLLVISQKKMQPE